MVKKKLIVIVGPTAVGKTPLAIELAKELGTEIISADSRQIFRELEIGTAKPSMEELAQVKHHFINIKSITEEYNAALFGKEALDRLYELFETKGIAVMCGGSGLYVKAVLEGFDQIPTIEVGIRDKINQEFEEKGLAWLQGQVQEIDPDYFSVVDTKNPQRLIRALEVSYSSGKPFSSWRNKQITSLPFEVMKIGLELPREELYHRIDKRMDEMIEKGLFEEAEKFYPQRQLNSLQTVGYQEIFGFLDGFYDKGESIRLLKRNSRNYAKRQMTWFKKDKEISWYRPDEMIQNLKILDSKWISL